MEQPIAGTMALMMSAAALAQTANFDTDKVGAPPAGWTCEVTGKGSPRWAVAAAA